MADNKKIETSKIDALYQWVSYDLQKVKEDLLNELKIASAQVGYLYKGIKEDKESAAVSLENEIRYSYKQNQNIYEGLGVLVKTQVADRLNSIDEKMSELEQLQATLSEITELRYSCAQLQSIYESLANVVVGEVAPKLDGIPTKEEMKECVDESVSVHTQKVADTVADLLNQLSANIESSAKVDYEKVAGDTAAKVVESLPYQEPVDYNRIEEMIANAVAKAVSVDAIAESVVNKMAAPELDEIAEAVADKVIIPEVDYDKLADVVLDKLAARGMSADIVLDDEGITKIADSVAGKVPTTDSVDYDHIANIVEEKLANISLVCEYVPAEEAIPATPVVEEPVEEPAEEVVETPVAPVQAQEEDDDFAIAALAGYQEDSDGQLIDAETGLVIRLKRSFTAKMKQSEERIKVYYSDIKNALTSYKKINSNVSWHGDRFNYGRDTIAKIGVNGKTLCFYLALDPNDPELKNTVYHQKDVGAQKAYENTPFLVKVKSDAAAKKALRLVGILADKLGAEPDESFEEVDYVAEFAYASTKRLFEDGDIKATKEKKVDFDF